jgi:hydroxymethylbilane synthase
MSTAGDQNQRSPLYVIGGDGRAIWTKELEVALAAGAVDALMLGAILEREDPRDALVIKAGLPYKVSRTCGPLQRCR